MPNYVPYHVHSDLSNLTVLNSADSVTKFTDYLDKAQELGMKAFGFSEHGSIVNFIKKKEEIEKRGMKYIHANEVYLTKYIGENENGGLDLVRDNYHYMLIAKNYEGVKEINRLTSASYSKEDGHFYYNPRITFEELKNTSDNIIMTSACLASPLWRLYNNAFDEYGEVKDEYLLKELHELIDFMAENNHRMFLEVQYHNHPQQISFNRWLLSLSKRYDIPLIAGTDTHALNEEQAKAREIYIKAKGSNYGDEDTFDLTFKSYDELVNKFKEQNALPESVILEAIENTNVMADMVEEFEIDQSHKYPKLYDDSVNVFKQKINEGVIERGIDKLPIDERSRYYKRIKDEFKTYEELGAIDYMLLQKNIIDWCHSNDIYQGYGRGSVSGSLIAYVMKITEVDPIKHNLIFERFLNPERVTMADIDVDLPSSRRQEVIDYVASLDGIDFAEIITFNTKKLKGSIRIVAKGLGMTLEEEDKIAGQVKTFSGEDHIDKKWRKKYPELFKYVDILIGVIESMGSHPSGFVVSPTNLEEDVGTLFTKESKYKVTAVNMKELEGNNYVKLDILGLKNIELINRACELAEIERLTPDNVPDDEEVWKSMRDSTLGVFQMESDTASDYLKQLFRDEVIEKMKNTIGDIDYISLMSMANGAIRPAGASYRNELANGEFNDNGHKALNDLLKNTLGQCIFQEQIIEFLVKFCGFTLGGADLVRRGLAKKIGTHEFIPKIKKGFIDTMTNEYGESEENAEEIIQYFLKVIEDASGYGFSINHSLPYSYTGYIGAYLRYHYPLQFLTAILNTMDDEKAGKIMNFAKENGYKIKRIEFGKSRAEYMYNEEEQSVYKGVASIKYLNARVGEELYRLGSNNYDTFVDLLVDIMEKTSAQSNQVEILIMLDYFKTFGQKEVLLEIYQCMADKKKPDTEKYPEFADKHVTETKKKRDGTIEEKVKTIKKQLKYDKKHIPKTKQQRISNLHEYESAVFCNPPKRMTLGEQIQYEKEKLGYAVSTYPELDETYAIIMDIDKTYTPKVYLYTLRTGEEYMVKVSKKDFYDSDDYDVLYVGDIIKVIETYEKQAVKMVDGKFQKIDKMDTYMSNCELVRGGSERGRVEEKIREESAV